MYKTAEEQHSHNLHCTTMQASPVHLLMGAFRRKKRKGYDAKTHLPSRSSVCIFSDKSMQSSMHSAVSSRISKKKNTHSLPFRYMYIQKAHTPVGELLCTRTAPIAPPTSTLSAHRDRSPYLPGFRPKPSLLPSANTGQSGESTSPPTPPPPRSTEASHTGVSRATALLPRFRRHPHRDLHTKSTGPSFEPTRRAMPAKLDSTWASGVLINCSNTSWIC